MPQLWIAWASILYGLSLYLSRNNRWGNLKKMDTSKQRIETALKSLDENLMRHTIEAIRKNLGWSRYKLAKIAKLKSTQTLYNYLNGRSAMRHDNLHKVLNCLLNKTPD